MLVGLKQCRQPFKTLKSFLLWWRTCRHILANFTWARYKAIELSYHVERIVGA